MATPKILLYYAFVPLDDPEAIKLWQHTLADSLGLRGRILLSRHGINGTLGGDVIELKKYVRRTKEYAPFHDIDFKWSDGTALPDGTTADFPRLSVKVREEIVTFGAADEIVVNADGIVGGGARLTPEQLHELTATKDVVFFDGRNRVEAAIGRFKDAVVPQVDTTREFLAELDSGIYDELKDKPIVTYCTGGVRCEVLSALMVNRGFSEVYQLEGGVVRYGETFRDQGLWEGSLYVFDDRKSVTFSDEAAVIGVCYRCGATTSRVEDCFDDSCLEQLVICDVCVAQSAPVCSAHSVVAQPVS
ncbi:rhodanese-related sulfurtransferase [soil metagenome]